MRIGSFRLRKWRTSIRWRMFLQISMALLLVISLMVFAIRTVLRSKLQADQIQLQLLKTGTMLDELDNYMMTLMSKTDVLFVDADFTSLIHSMPQNMVENVEKTTAIKDMLDNTMFNLRYPEITITDYSGGQISARLYIRESGLYLDNQFIYSFEEIETEDYIRELMSETRMFSWNSGYDKLTGSYVAFNRRLLSYDTLEDIAILQLRIPVSKVLTILKPSENEHVIACYYISTNSDLICAYGNREYLSQVQDIPGGTGQVLTLEATGKQAVVNCVQSGLNGYRLVAVSSMDPIYESIEFLTPIFMIGGMVAVLLGCVLMFLLSGSLLKGMRQLVNKAQIASSATDKYEQLDPIRDTTEIEELDDAYARMVSTINSLHEQEAKNQELLNQVQIELLQEQFNPHLLYNTLSMVRHMEGESGQNRSGPVLDHLISFYRQVLNRGQLITRVREEMRMIGNYMSIVREVYDIDLTYVCDVEEAVMDCCTVKMFLQPLVENAVLHGVRQVGSGTITITGRLEGGTLHFAISDDGLGMEPELLEQLQQMVNSPAPEESHSYGYVSVARRLRLFYGDSYHMKLTSELDEGTRIDLYISALREDQISQSLRSRMI